MRRGIATAALTALLAGSCAESDLSAGVAERLGTRVARIRGAAEGAEPMLAIDRLEGLEQLVAKLVRDGDISEERAIEIAEAIEVVRSELALLVAGSPSPSPTPPSPPPSEEPDEEESDEGEDHEDKGEDKGKDKDEGDKGKGNDEGHGNDD